MLGFLIFCENSYASEEIISKFEVDLDGDEKPDAVTFKRVADSTSYTVGKEVTEAKFGQEELIVFSGQDTSKVLFNKKFEYYNVQNVNESTGSVEIKKIDEKLPARIVYILKRKGAGSGAENTTETYSIYGWDGEKIVLLFQTDILSYNYVYPRSYADKWEKGSYREIKKTVDFIDLNGDGFKDIKIMEDTYEELELQKDSESKEIKIVKERPNREFFKSRNIKEYIWNNENCEYLLSTK